MLLLKSCEVYASSKAKFYIDREVWAIPTGCFTVSDNFETPSFSGLDWQTLISSYMVIEQCCWFFWCTAWAPISSVRFWSLSTRFPFVLFLLYRAEFLSKINRNLALGNGAPPQYVLDQFAVIISDCSYTLALSLARSASLSGKEWN